MSRKLIAALCLLTAINVMASIINMSSPSKGEPSKAAPSASKAAPSKGAAGTTKYQQFIRDPDFTRAVRDIVQECTVNVDIAKLEC
jgi:hypothetical protein